MSDEYRGSTNDLVAYPCGLHAGDPLRLIVRLEIEDYEGQVTGEVHEAGELWTVIVGSATEPGVVWLQQPNGKEHTWDASDIFASFARVRAT